MTRKTLTIKSLPPQGIPVDSVVERICYNCRFMADLDDGSECRRRPAFFDNGYGRWPKVQQDIDWCGEFRRLPIGQDYK